MSLDLIAVDRQFAEVRLKWDLRDGRLGLDCFASVLITAEEPLVVENHNLWLLLCHIRLEFVVARATGVG